MKKLNAAINRLIEARDLSANLPNTTDAIRLEAVVGRLSTAIAELEHFKLELRGAKERLEQMTAFFKES
jgi:hypothetical protein